MLSLLAFGSHGFLLEAPQKNTPNQPTPRDLFFGLWVPDLFMKRCLVIQNNKRTDGLGMGKRDSKGVSCDHGAKLFQDIGI